VNVAVGSCNQIKLNAARLGFQLAWPSEYFEFMGVEVQSGVSHQPMSIAETRCGASNRAEHARRKLPDADYWVGMEGGVFQQDDDWFEVGWIHVLDRHGRGSSGATLTFPVAPIYMRHLLEGCSLNEAIERETGISSIGSSRGFVSLMTHGVIDRTKAYGEATLVALTGFMAERWEVDDAQQPGS
jgi:inosine/xanthosine triphosphatase